MDRDIQGYVHNLRDEALGRDITYRRVSDPEPVVQPLGHALAHFFNHQTHHRGQCHAILTGLGAEAPVLDLLIWQRTH